MAWSEGEGSAQKYQGMLGQRPPCFTRTGVERGATMMGFRTLQRGFEDAEKGTVTLVAQLHKGRDKEAAVAYEQQRAEVIDVGVPGEVT